MTSAFERPKTNAQRFALTSELTFPPTNAVYVHIPFCAKHCAYCDFNTYVEKAQPRIAQTVEAIRQDIAFTARSLPSPPQIETVFFGGGTPTLLSSPELVSLLSAVRDHFPVSETAEISSEANPASSDAEKFAAMRNAGFNRLSIGVQSLDNALLVALDRFHSVEEAERAIEKARKAGFTNLNLDLMFGLPRQTLSLWKETLEAALRFSPEHLSLYALTLEPGTRFERLNRGGKLSLPDEDTELEMYEWCIERLTQEGFEHYEVSNFARSGTEQDYRCRHNQVYWHNRGYFGFGPGAVSYLDGERAKREKLPLRYIEKAAQGADLRVEAETLSPEETLGETLMLGLRLREGISLTEVEKRFGVKVEVRFAELIARLVREGFLLEHNNRIALTHKGLLFANTVLGEFLV